MSGEPFTPHTDTPTLLQEVLAERDRLTDSHYAAIGRVAVNWGYFEAVIDTWCIHLTDLSAKTLICFTAQIMGWRGKLDAFISLADLLGTPKETIKTLHSFATDTMGLAEQRNRAVHDVWLLDNPDLPIRFEATARKKVRLETINVPTDELLHLADRIDRHTEKFDHIAKAIFVALPPSPGKPLPTPYRQENTSPPPDTPPPGPHARPQSSGE